MVTGSSGTGKTTLIKRLLRSCRILAFSVSATTREKRAGETDGVDYVLVSKERFKNAEGVELLEWAEVYGNFYGTPRQPVEKALQEGKSILLEIDVQGARQVKKLLPQAVLVFVLPVLERDRDASWALDGLEAIIARRVDEAMVQIAACGEFDYLVVNDDLEEAHKIFQSVLISELCRTHRRESLVHEMTQSEG